jgi:hypothetical protein
MEGMSRQFFPGGSYVDALPSGEFCVLYFGARVDTHRGSLTLPPGEQGPLFLRCSNVGGFKFAGQAHDGLGGYEWREAEGWRAFPPPCCGVSPVIYDRDGMLHISDCSIGSQGYRFVDADGRIFSGDETYGSPYGLNEWSRYQDLYIGQGHQGGGVLVYGGFGLLVLETGDCRFIRVNGDGDRVAISFVKPDGAVIVQTTLAELRALQPLSTQPPPIVTPPPPVPKPEPPPMSDSLPAAVLNTIARYAQRFPVPQMSGSGPSDDAFENVCRAWCRALAEQVQFETGDARWGVKNAGGSRPQSKDSLAFNGPRLINYDLLGGVGTGHPSLVGQPAGEDITGQTFMPVTGVDHLGGAPPPRPVPVPGQPPPPSVDLSPVLDLLHDLQARIHVLESRRVALKTHDGHYVCAEQGGGGTVNATRTSPGAWETFSLEPQP